MQEIQRYRLALAEKNKLTRASQQVELDRLRGALANAVEYFDLVLRKIPLPLTFKGQLASYKAALNPPSAESENSDGISIDARTEGK